jgi:hypothetical protein
MKYYNGIFFLASGIGTLFCVIHGDVKKVQLRKPLFVIGLILIIGGLVDLFVLKY